MTAYELVVENDLCWGCRACEVACKQENRAADGIRLIRVLENGPRMTDGRLDFIFQVNLCRHCEQPACADVCPVEAITRKEDGIVVMDYEQCTGCRLCVEACPYEAISFDARQGIAQKCNLCYHRIEQGLVPACADNVCLAHCIHFKSS